MTVVIDPYVVPAPEPQEAPRTEAPDLPIAPAGWAVTGAAITILAALLLGFAAHLLLVSHLQHARSQEIAYDDLRAGLARATTPVGQTDNEGNLVRPGEPIALLVIPQLGIHEVVGEGTTSGVLSKGPGHRRDTVLPGQTGTSIIMGRNFAYGGPFRDIDRLQPGDELTVTTGQGRHLYEVLKVRRAGSLQAEPVEPGEGRLTLITAEGPWFMPTGAVRVDADLVSDPQPTPTKRIRSAEVLPAAEQIMAGDRAALVPIVFWAQALLLAAGAVVFAHARWGRWQAWIVGVPLLAAIALTLADELVRLMPNLY